MSLRLFSLISRKNGITADGYGFKLRIIRNGIDGRAFSE